MCFDGDPHSPWSLLPNRQHARHRQRDRREDEGGGQAKVASRFLPQPAGDTSGVWATHGHYSLPVASAVCQRNVNVRLSARRLRPPQLLVVLDDRSGEPPRNRTDGEADALPRIGLLPSSRHGSIKGCAVSVSASRCRPSAVMAMRRRAQCLSIDAQERPLLISIPKFRAPDQYVWKVSDRLSVQKVMVSHACRRGLASVG